MQVYSSLSLAFTNCSLNPFNENIILWHIKRCSKDVVFVFSIFITFLMCRNREDNSTQVYFCCKSACGQQNFMEIQDYLLNVRNTHILCIMHGITLFSSIVCCKLIVVEVENTMHLSCIFFDHIYTYINIIWYNNMCIIECILHTVKCVHVAFVHIYVI